MKQTKTMKALALLLIATLFSTSLLIGGCSSESTPRAESRAESRAEETGPSKIQESFVLRPGRQFSFAYTWYRSTERELLLTYNATLDSLRITARTDNLHMALQKVTLSATDAATGLTADFIWQLAGDEKTPDIYVTRSFKTLTAAEQPDPSPSAAQTGLRGSALLTMVNLDCLGQSTLARLLQCTPAKNGNSMLAISAVGWTATPSSVIPAKADTFTWNGQDLIRTERQTDPPAPSSSPVFVLGIRQEDELPVNTVAPQDDLYVLVPAPVLTQFLP